MKSQRRLPARPANADLRRLGQWRDADGYAVPGARIKQHGEPGSRYSARNIATSTEQLEQGMEAIDVMHTKLVTILPGDTVEHAARLMLKHGISGLPVVEDDGRVVGMVTEGDLLHRVENDTQRHRSLLSEMFSSSERLAGEFVKSTGRQVKDVMTRGPVSVGEEALLGDIADLFDLHKIKRVPVLRDGKLVGIVTRSDLLRALVGFGGPRAEDLGLVDFP